jgi:hypothetical protein
MIQHRDLRLDRYTTAARAHRHRRARESFRISGTCGLFEETMAASSTNPADESAPPLERRRGRTATLVALGASLAGRGPLSVAAIAISVFTALGACLLAVWFAFRDGDAPVRSVPVLASGAIAWGGAFLHAVVASMNGLRRDRTEGVTLLFLLRTTSLRDYTIARLFGLAGVLALEVAGGTLVVSLVSVLAAARVTAVAFVLPSAAGSIVFGLAFALVIAPVAFATLGARGRGTGYLALLFVLVVPELVAPQLRSVLSEDVAELCAIPSALDALRSSIASGDLLRALRALLALGLISSVASLIAHRDVVRLEREDA